MSEVANQPKKALRPSEQPVKPSKVYKTLLPVVRFLFKTILPVRYHGTENLPETAPYILMGNHLSFVDPVIMAVGAPQNQIRFIAKKELFTNKLLGPLVRSLNAIPVDRHNTDMEAMRACMRVTRDGGVLGIFPEGTRHHKGLMEEVESGVALIALRARVPLIPTYITGRLGLFRRLDVYFGEEISMDDLRANGINTESCSALLRRITDTYAKLEAARPDA